MKSKKFHKVRLRKSRDVCLEAQPLFRAPDASVIPNSRPSTNPISFASRSKHSMSKSCSCCVLVRSKERQADIKSKKIVHSANANRNEKNSVTTAASLPHCLLLPHCHTAYCWLTACYLLSTADSLPQCLLSTADSLPHCLLSTADSLPHCK